MLKKRLRNITNPVVPKFQSGDMFIHIDADCSGLILEIFSDEYHTNYLVLWIKPWEKRSSNNDLLIEYFSVEIGNEYWKLYEI